MKNLTLEQQQKVEANLGLVGKVLADKVHGKEFGIYTREDLYQIGCIGLCKAAATDKGGCFSTYAYRLIWNEICSALIYASRRTKAEIAMETGDLERCGSEKDWVLESELRALLDRGARTATGVAAKGMQAIRLRLEGYSTKEISERLGVPQKYVTAWESKARKYLQVLQA